MAHIRGKVRWHCTRGLPADGTEVVRAVVLESSEEFVGLLNRIYLRAEVGSFKREWIDSSCEIHEPFMCVNPVRFNYKLT